MDQTETVEVIITNNLSSSESVRRFPSHISILQLKNRLELITGASSETMKVQILDKTREVLVHELDNEKELISYPIENGMFLHVLDPSLRPGEFENVSVVEKFELSEEEYLQRKNTFRAFKQQQLQAQKSSDKEDNLSELDEAMAKIPIGHRCEVHVSKQPSRRGTVRFVGKTDFKPGYWIGVEYDEPLGKNDGSCQGKRYFECAPNYGGFVRPLDVSVGNFPPKECDEEI